MVTMRWDGGLVKTDNTSMAWLRLLRSPSIPICSIKSMCLWII